MRAVQRVADLMFWIMVLLSGTVLGAGLLVPAWSEYQAAGQARDARMQYINDLRGRITISQKQREHLTTDPAYIERLARQEFGFSVPGVQTVLLTSAAEANAADPAAEPESTGGPTLPPQIAALLTDAVHRYPALQLFTIERTRPVIMVMAGVLLIAAIVLLGKKPARADAADTAGPTA